MVYLNDIQDFETAAQELFKQQPLRTFWIKAKSFFPEGDHHFVGFFRMFTPVPWEPHDPESLGFSILT